MFLTENSVANSILSGFSRWRTRKQVTSQPDPCQFPKTTQVYTCEEHSDHCEGSMPWNKVVLWVILLLVILMAYVTYLHLAPMD